MIRLVKTCSYALLSIGVGVAAACALGQDGPQNGTPDQSFTLRRTPLSFDQFVARQRQLEQDLSNQRQMLNARRAELLRWNGDDQQAFSAAFGTTDTAARDQMLGYIDRELALNAQMTAGNFQETPVSRPGRYAYVHPGDQSTIYLDDQYFASSPTGQDSRAGTLTHEMSHFHAVGSTQDYVYGMNNASSLSRNYASGSEARQPVRNADNVEYFVEGGFNRSQAPSNGQHSQPQSSNYQPRQTIVVDENAPRRGDAAANRFADAASQPATAASQSPFSQSSTYSQEQFRADMERNMRDFREADARNQREPLTIEVPDRSAVPGDEAGSAPAGRVASNAFGDSYGGDNRIASGRPSPNDDVAAQPARLADPAPVVASTRENRAYGPYDDSSRPIGNGRASAAQSFQAIQQWSQAQISRQRQSRSIDAGASANSTGAAGNNGGGYAPTATDSPAPTARYVYDESRPRENRAYSSDGTSRPVGSGSNSSVAGRISYDEIAVGRDPIQLPARQNRAYSTDGSSRPIGSSEPSLQQPSPRPLAQPSSGSTRASQFNPQVDSTPRLTSPVQQGPAVTPRQPGTRGRTAGLAILE